MQLIIIILILLVSVLVFFLKKNIEVNIVPTLIITVFIAFILINPKQCITATLKGANLFFFNVFPSLFVFLILCNLLIFYDGISVYSKAIGKFLCYPLRIPEGCTLAIIISIFCGYPLGAKYTIDLYENKIIDKSTTGRLLNIATNPSPIFVVGALGTAMLKDTNLGYLLLLCNYISCFIMSLLIPPSKSLNIAKASISKKNPNFGMALKNSVEGAISTTLMVGGFITFFYLITSIINNNLSFLLTSNTSTALLNGITEMTQGCALISASSLSLTTKLIICSFFISFSGISVIAQVYSFIFKYDISIIKYISLKFVQGTIASIIMFFMSKVYIVSINSVNTFQNTTNYLYVLLGFILITALLLVELKKLFFRDKFF